MNESTVWDRAGGWHLLGELLVRGQGGWEGFATDDRHGILCSQVIDEPLS